MRNTMREVLGLVLSSQSGVRLILLGSALLTSAHGPLAWGGPRPALQPLATRQEQGALEAQTEAALLQEDWAALADLLSASAPPSPLTRFIKGHAHLALNKNNESVCLFVGASADDVQVWAQWTQDFVKRHPQQAVAHYFRGDALARLAQWDAALKAFHVAVQLQPAHTLALNARGVTYALKRAWDQALGDFRAAFQAQPSFADAYASYGTMYVQKKAGADGVLRWAQRALEIAPDFALALNTRGGAKFAMHEWGEAQKDFEEASKHLECFPDVLANLALSAGLMHDAIDKELVRLAAANPGVTMQQLIQDMSPVDRERFAKMVTGLRDHSLRSLGVLEAMPQKFVAIIPRGAFGYATNFDNWRKSTQEHIGQYNQLLTQLGGPRSYTPSELKTLAVGYAKGTIPGGVSTDMSTAYVDKGNWPFVVHYGLLYRTPAQ